MEGVDGGLMETAEGKPSSRLSPKRVVHPPFPYLHDLTSNSLPMSMFRDINSMDARRAAFHNVGRDQINADQVNINISNNQTGAMQRYSCASLYILT